MNAWLRVKALSNQSEVSTDLSLLFCKIRVEIYSNNNTTDT